MEDQGTTYAKHIKDTLAKADHYLLAAGSASVIFWVFSFAEYDAEVSWSLLGFPLALNGFLAQVFSFCLCGAALIFGDQAVLHCRDLITRTGLDRGTALAAMACPSILTLGPIGRFLVTFLPSGLLAHGLWNVHSNSTWPLTGLAWLVPVIPVVWGPLVFLHAQSRLGAWFLDRAPVATEKAEPPTGVWASRGRRSNSEEDSPPLYL